MLPKNFDFAMLPKNADLKLSEIGMLASSIETIDYAIVEWLKEDLDLSARTNEGWTKVPVLWQAPEKAPFRRIPIQKTKTGALGAW